jgi:hypothetical protein
MINPENNQKNHLNKMDDKKSANLYIENIEISAEITDISLNNKKNQNLIKKIENENENENLTNKFSNFLNFVTFGFVDESSPVTSKKHNDSSDNYNDNNNNFDNNYENDNTNNNTQKSQNEESFVINSKQNNTDKINSSPFKGKWNVDASTQTGYSEFTRRQQKSTSLKCVICIIM